MENPYWRPEVKPHIVDPDELRLIAFELYAIVRASMSMAGQGIEPEEDEDPEPGPIEQLFYDQAEIELSKKLLRLAVLLRTLDDYLTGDEEYAKAVAELGQGVGTAFKWEKDPETVLTFRDALNKIIHATDVRPAYDSDDDRESKHARWGMDGQLELEGERQGKTWKVAVYLVDFLEAAIGVASFIEAAEDKCDNSA